MSFVKIWIHTVWGTKNRYPFLQPEWFRKMLIKHMLETSHMKDYHVELINGVSDHLHALIQLKPTQHLDKIMQHLKGESAHWVNQQKLLTYNFKWSHRYYAASVSESHRRRVKAYINNQEKHHQVKTWKEEYEEFLQIYGFEVSSDIVD